ncbi:glycoside hydrolase family 9 protein [Acaryochloris sp. IP29b_bin.148]|uniref:glycoside hydrolase family 9 protein n=1 Tax=Acaryochloris sp. IP29b_bin.148 TaxID=2969218 RepID=UPI0026036919|nr:glycoside hydrolase family 9 protein [Acaryochloris sp. IP29b_bin.148]
MPEIEIGNVTVSEADDQAVFEVTLTDASDQRVTVQYSTANGTALSGSDYEAQSGRAIFEPGQTSTLIRINLLEDTADESNENFSLELSQPANADLANTVGVATIQDNDSSMPPVPPSPSPTDPPSTPPQSGALNYGEALQKSFLFYEAQRSGPLPSDNRIAWRGDSTLQDGQDVSRDLNGGYFDAGDHVKFGFPMAAAMTMLGWGVNQYRDAYQQSGQLDEALAAVKWGTDYILKAHVADANGTQAFWGQVGNGGIDHAYWGAPETLPTARPSYKIDRQNPGSDLAGESAAALAAAATIFRPTNQAYADRLVTNAEQLFEFADTYRGNYSDSIPDAANFYNSFSGFNDELVWAATWLYKATGRQTYLDKAESYYQGITSGSHDWDNKSAGAAVLLAQITGKDRYKSDIEAFLDRWSDDSGAGISYTDGGLAWHQQWGSTRHSANASFLASVYGDTVNDKGGRYSQFAKDQIDYLLGDNPNNFSYQVGFGDNFARNPHHRAASGTTDVNDPAPNQHIIYGALVGGPTSPSDDAYADVRSDFIANEVALDYNAGFTGVLASLYEDFGGNPLSDSQLDNLAGIDV